MWVRTGHRSSAFPLFCPVLRERMDFEKVTAPSDFTWQGLNFPPRKGPLPEDGKDVSIIQSDCLMTSTKQSLRRLQIHKSGWGTKNNVNTEGSKSKRKWYIYTVVSIQFMICSETNDTRHASSAVVKTLIGIMYRNNLLSVRKSLHPRTVFLISFI